MLTKIIEINDKIILKYVAKKCQRFKLDTHSEIMLIQASTNSHLVNAFHTYIIWTSALLYSLTIIVQLRNMY